MERLAEKLKDILNEQDFCFEPWEIKVVEKALNRFAAYENTGLEPKEIQAIAGIASENCAKTADAIDKLLQDDAELESYRDLGPIDHLRELVQADQEGRCVVFAPGHPVVSAYYKDEDGVFVRDVTGVVTEEEYKAALRGEQE